MSGVLGSSTPAFRAVNAMEITTTDTQNAEPSPVSLPLDPSQDVGSASALTNVSQAPAAAAAATAAGVEKTAAHTTTTTTTATTATTTTTTTTPDMGVEGSDGGDSANNADSPNTSEKASGSGKSAGKAKKKKGSKFHCKGYGDCNLSFTRSEHLARHIRKHTGERPFMCHCGRWFSRLDNLRQHSSTVHADEDIPGDSLAATGTRYQRHVRTERVRPPARSRAQSQSEVQSPEPQTPQTLMSPASPPDSSSSIGDRPQRRRPDPIQVPSDITQMEAAFSQYRSQTPPDSPVSTASTYYRPGNSYRTAPYPPVSQNSTPLATTPTPTRRHSRNLESPFSTPSNSARNSMNLSNFHLSEMPIASRRLSMPVPPSPGIFESRSNTLPLPNASPSPSESGRSSRRDSLSPNVVDDRRKTWHMGSPPNYHSSLSNEILSPTTHSLSRASIHGGSTDSQSSSTATSRLQLPSINHILQEISIPSTPTTPVPASTPEHNRLSWTGAPTDLSEKRMSADLEKSLLDTAPITSRRVPPGQVRSSHGRSISNIETGSNRRWGVVIPSNNGPVLSWAERERREAIVQPQFSVESARKPPQYATIQQSPQPFREQRPPFGFAGELPLTEGPLALGPRPVDISQPRSFGEPGEAVYRSEVALRPTPPSSNYRFPPAPAEAHNDESSAMSGIEPTGRPLTPVIIQHDRPVMQTDRPSGGRVGEPKRRSFFHTPLETLVAVATGQTKI